MCHLLPFPHAIAGCDTTSCLFGIGKGIALWKLSSDIDFKKEAEVFSGDGNVSKDDINSAGEKALSCLCGSHSGEGLDVLRYRCFSEKVAKCMTSVQLNTLPPITAAASYHSARMYYQVKQWMGKADSLEPENWTWC